jgi:hypothetical protein
VWLWQEKRLPFQSLKDSGKNNKEIRKLLLLFNNKDNKEELQTRPESNKSPPEPNNTKLNIRLNKGLKSTPEDK